LPADGFKAEAEDTPISKLCCKLKKFSLGFKKNQLIQLFSKILLPLIQQIKI